MKGKAGVFAREDPLCPEKSLDGRRKREREKGARKEAVREGGGRRPGRSLV